MCSVGAEPLTLLSKSVSSSGKFASTESLLAETIYEFIALASSLTASRFA